MSAPTLILVDPHLKDFAHHHFNYDMAIVREARHRGLRVRLLVSNKASNEVVSTLPAEPVLDSLIHTPIKFKLANALRIGPAGQFLYAVAKRFLDLRKFLSPGVDRGTVVFVPTCDARNLAAWILWSALQSRETSPVILLMLRFPCTRNTHDSLSGPIRAGYALSLKCLAWLDSSERIKLCTDSKLLAKQYAELTSRHIAVLPIPHTGGFVENEAAEKRPRRCSQSVIVALGDARKEKGFDTLVEAIIRLSSSSRWRELTFKVHCPVHETHHEMQHHVDRLRGLAQENVSLIQTFLSESEYYSLLDTADIVVMPYRRENYECRTSGPLIEAMAAGKLVIGTDRTWLGEKIAEYGGGATFSDGDVDGLAKAILMVHRNRSDFLEKAQIGARAIQAENCPENFLDCLANVAMT